MPWNMSIIFKFWLDIFNFQHLSPTGAAYHLQSMHHQINAKSTINFLKLVIRVASVPQLFLGSFERAPLLLPQSQGGRPLSAHQIPENIKRNVYFKPLQLFLPPWTPPSLFLSSPLASRWLAPGWWPYQASGGVSCSQEGCRERPCPGKGRNQSMRVHSLGGDLITR